MFDTVAHPNRGTSREGCVVKRSRSCKRHNGSLTLFLQYAFFVFLQPVRRDGIVLALDLPSSAHLMVNPYRLQCPARRFGWRTDQAAIFAILGNGHPIRRSQINWDDIRHSRRSKTQQARHCNVDAEITTHCWVAVRRAVSFTGTSFFVKGCAVSARNGNCRRSASQAFQLR